MPKNYCATIEILQRKIVDGIDTEEEKKKMAKTKFESNAERTRLVSYGENSTRSDICETKLFTELIISVALSLFTLTEDSVHRIPCMKIRMHKEYCNLHTNSILHSIRFSLAIGTEVWCVALVICTHSIVLTAAVKWRTYCTLASASPGLHSPYLSMVSVYLCIALQCTEI